MRLTLLAFLLAVALVLTYTHCQPQPYAQGKILYTNFCADCHGEQGQGLGKLYPPLQKSVYFQDSIAKVPCIIRHGLQDSLSIGGVRYTQPMPPIPRLSATEIANIINYIRHEWYGGVPQQMINDATVQRWLGECRQ